MSAKANLDVIAIIPARGGSKRLPRKNVLPVGGRPLIAHTVMHAFSAKSVGTVYVSTDDNEIAVHSKALGAEVVERPAELASDTATSESVLSHVLDQRMLGGLPDPELVVFLQCTCPLRASDDIDRAIATLRQNEANSLFSACRETPFIWCVGPNGPQSVTYDYQSRRRTQEWQPHYRENGSIYVFRPWVLRQNNNRLGGKIALHEMSFWSSFDIDSADDLHLVQWIFDQNAGGLTARGS